jgi:hypothetical protein
MRGITPVYPMIQRRRSRKNRFVLIFTILAALGGAAAAYGAVTVAGNMAAAVGGSR